MEHSRRQGGGTSLVIDTDGGVDDAIALMLALSHVQKRTDVQIAGVTTVGGNVSAAQAAHNVDKILTRFGQGVVCPVYVGCSEPMVARSFPPGWPGHGNDGLGGDECVGPAAATASSTAATPRDDGIASSHAVEALLRMVRDADGIIDIVALGPLTNIAMAIKLDPGWAARLGRLVVMGGAADGRGNTTEIAEFNVAADPEAASVVFRAFSENNRRLAPRLTMVPWETCLKHGLSWEYFDMLTAAKQPGGEPSAQSRFLKQICAAYEKCERSAGSDSVEGAFVPCDAYAVAAYLWPSLVAKCEVLHCDVELGGSHCRGTTCFDWYRRHGGKHTNNVQLVLEIQQEVFEQALREMFHSTTTTQAPGRKVSTD